MNGAERAEVIAAIGDHLHGSVPQTQPEKNYSLSLCNDGSNPLPNDKFVYLSPRVVSATSLWYLRRS